MAAETPKSAQKEALQQQQQQAEDLETTLSDLEQKIDRLKVLYDQYFMGIEKLEPQVPRKDATRLINNLSKIQIRNTGLRFRYRTLVQRFNVYLTHWNRILREIDAGTYERDVARAQRNMARRGVELTPEAAVELGLKPKSRPAEDGEPATVPNLAAAAAAAVAMMRPSPDAAVAAAMGVAPRPAAGTPDGVPVVTGTPRDGLPAARPPTPAGVPAAGRPPTPAGVPAAGPGVVGGMSMDQVQTLFRRLTHAKKLCGESTDGLKLETLIATINKQAPKIMAEHKCREVEFTVAIKGDKTVLKAVPKK
jgi:hypothetical protein